jgi:sugar phosphate isomerase/epimerase
MRDFASDHCWFSLNTITVRKQGDFLAIVDTCARHGVRAVSPWRDQVADVGLQRAARAIRDNGLVLSGYCRGGMFTADPDHLSAARDDNRRALEEAKTLGAPCLVLVVGGLPQFSRPGSAPSKDISGARAMVEDEIARLAEHARAEGMPLALEPLHPMYAADRACVNTLEQALDICDRVDPGRTGLLGVAIDVYHVWWDPKVFTQIKRGGARILAFHVCDWLVPSRDLLLDRGMMGDGVVDIRGLRAAVEAEGYAGHVEVEILSNRWWSEPMDHVIATAIERFKSVV